MSPSEPRRNIAVQVSNALGAPVTGVDLEVHVGGKLIKTIRKNTEEPARIKIAPPEASVTIVARIPDVDPKEIPGLAPQRQKLGLSTSRCDFVFRGAGAPVVLIVCAKACEEAAVRATCDWVSPKPFSRQNDTNIYREGIYLQTDGRTIRKVLIVTAGMNNLNANSVTTQALISFPQLKHILMSGIAGGCPNHQKPPEHVRLGDIVVPDYRGIVQYDHFKATLENGEEVRKPRSHPQAPSAAMLQAATQLDAGAALGERPWEPWISKGSPGL